MENEKDMTRGFNAGYMLEQKNPALTRKLTNGFTDRKHPYVQGFVSGVQEYARERIISQLGEHGQSNDRDADRGDYDR